VKFDFCGFCAFLRPYQRLIFHKTFALFLTSYLPASLYSRSFEVGVFADQEMQKKDDSIKQANNE
jgi:hypothetical protein